MEVKIEFDTILCYVCKKEIGTIVISQRKICGDCETEYPIKLCAKCADDLTTKLLQYLGENYDAMTDDHRDAMIVILRKVAPEIFVSCVRDALEIVTSRLRAESGGP